MPLRIFYGNMVLILFKRLGVLHEPGTNVLLTVYNGSASLLFQFIKMAQVFLQQFELA